MSNPIIISRLNLYKLKWVTFKTRYSLKLKNKLYCKFKPNLVKIPNLMVCTDSMHSKHKVQEKYPSVNETVIQQLYGLHTSDAQRRMWKVRKSIPDLFDLLRGTYEKEYTKLNAINLTQFYIDTTPVYYMFQCKWPATCIPTYEAAPIQISNMYV